jgi:GDP-4-dehydro-6-deoxy-D-mannose reductase
VGDLTTRRDFSDVRDVVRAYRLLMERGRSGEVYNVASGHDTALIDVAHELVAQIAPDVQLVPDVDLLRPVEVPVMRGSYRKLHAATGWEPTISLSTSLSDVVSELRSRRVH